MLTESAPAMGIRRFVPRGAGLPSEQWRRRHTVTLTILWLHVGGALVYGLVQGFSPEHAVLEAAAIGGPAIIASFGRNRRLRTVAAAAGLLTASAVLVHFSGGLIEMHFHFFVMVAVVAMYHDWTPFILAVVYVLLHHGLAGAIDPASVFNHPAAVARPWTWAGVHALFIAAISLALLTYWKMNENHIAEQQRAEQRARREASTVVRLNEIGRRLTGDLDREHVIQNVVEAAAELTGADAAGFSYLDGDPRDRGSFAAVFGDASRLPSEALSPDGVRRTPDEMWRAPVRSDDLGRDERFAIQLNGAMSRSYLAVPVRARNRLLGGLSLGHAEPGRFGEDEQRVVESLAVHAAAAIEVATIFEAERKARERLSTLTDAGQVLVGSLDLDAMIARLAHLIVPVLADAFVADIFDADGTLRRVLVHVDERIEDTSHRSFAAPDLTNDASPVVQALRSGEVVVMAEMPEDLPERIVDPEYRALIERIQPTSGLIVPLRLRGIVLGAFTIATLRASGRRLDPDARGTLEDLARTAAAAVENATLYARQKSTADILQHALLPEDLPELPGISIAARYLPGGPGVGVGGDWYDALALHDGSLILAMGDVVGRGIQAATLMGMLKHAMRAYIFADLEPAEILQRLNALLNEEQYADHMATLVLARFDLGTGELVTARAGHPAPLLVSRDGAPVFLEEATGLPLGAVPAARYAQTTIRLSPGDEIILYTDGLIEGRHISLQDGMAQLQQAAELRSYEDLATLCERLVAIAPGKGEDDTAILVMRWEALGDVLDYRFAATPSILRPLRATFRRWLREAGAGEEEVGELEVAISEVIANVIQHSGTVSSIVRFTADRRDDITITIRDNGRWREPSADRGGGLGLELVRAFTSDVEVVREGDGTAVLLRRSLAGKRR